MYSRKTEKQRGRLETREYYYTEEIEWFIKRNKEWKEVKGIGASILTTEENGKKQEQKRYYITNITGGVEEFVRAVRRHWAIEISLDTGCDIQRRCKQDIEQKCGKKLKYSKEISNLNTRIAAVQKEIQQKDKEIYHIIRCKKIFKIIF